MGDGSSLTADDLEEIRQLKARYCRAVDTKDWDGFRGLFAPHGMIGPLDNGLPEEILASRPPRARSAVSPRVDVESFVARAEPSLASVITTHHVHQSEIWSTGGGVADGIWAMEDVLVWLENGFRFRGTGHYWESYRKLDGAWKFTSVRLTRLYTYAERIDGS